MQHWVGVLISFKRFFKMGPFPTWIAGGPWYMQHSIGILRSF
jgi:hypothetical protein